MTATLYCIMYTTQHVFAGIYFFCLFATATLMNLPSPERRSLTRPRKRVRVRAPCRPLNRNLFVHTDLGAAQWTNRQTA